MLVSRIDRLLARTDPFDLSQAVESHVRTLSGDHIRALLRTAAPHLGAYYREEFARLAGSGDFENALKAQGSEAVLKNAFVKFLKSNLRAIPIFGNAFGLALLEHAPLDRAVAIGEEGGNRFSRGALVGGAALALILAGAAGEHVIAGARASLQSPQPVVMLPPATFTTPRPVQRKAVPATPQQPKSRVLARVPTSDVPTPVPQPVEQAPAATIGPAPRPQTPAPARPSALPNGAGVVEVTAQPQTPTPQPSDIDVTDMPESYSDATPLPQQSPMTAPVPADGIRVPTPKPSPKKHSWIHQTFSHLNPFKP